MFSKFKSVTYYTECKSFLQKSVSFLQSSNKTATKNAIDKLSRSVFQKGNSTESGDFHKDAETTTMCWAKFASFTGTTLKPDPSGKCDLCLKTADKAQRCFFKVQVLTPDSLK